jgi:predicted O-methyltransferase YrrM
MPSIDSIPSPCFDFADIYDDAVKRFSSGSKFVEIGIWEGRSTCHMADRIKRSAKKIKFIAIDTFSNKSRYKRFLKNVTDNKLEDYIDICVGRSQDVAKLPWFLFNKFEFVFVDGSHKYDDVYDDLRFWYPLVREKGVFAGHDFLDEKYSPDVKVAVEKFTSENRIKFEIRGTSWWIQK